ncbi:monocarboxylate transporter 9 [Lingula anatina]|uniref:Monocarboxylate transporter 9 n=1 Tax=Lingula anatina TaxID=7574 RepID=A0A1S3J918_LINAN|nr:monocarboxylate transporter 9 [Lingula anatina]|eukprot:XP_013406716.1 monocarboxylate transporter 9 [Lingula anatina]
MADGDVSVHALGEELCPTDGEGEKYIEKCVQDLEGAPGSARGEVSEEMPDCVVSPTETQAPDGGWGWMCVFGCFIVSILGAGMDRTFGVIYLILIDMFGSSAKLTGGILSVFSACRLCLGPVSSSLANLFTARKVVISGGLLSSLGLILSAFPPNIYYLFFTFGLVAGFGAALCGTPSIVIVGQYFHKKRALANSIATVGAGIGSLILPPFLTYLVYLFDYSGQMLIMGAIMLNQVVSGALYRPLAPRRNHDRQVRSTTKSAVKEHNEFEENIIFVEKCMDDSQIIDITTADNLEVKQTFTERKTSSAVRGSTECHKLRPDTFPESIQQEKCSQTFGNPVKRSTVVRRNAVLHELRAYGNLLKDARFLTFGLNWTCLGMGPPTGLMFLGAIAEEHGVPRSQSPFLYSILSIFDIAARIMVALLCDRTWLRWRRHHVYNMGFVVLGVVLCIVPEGRTFLQFSACASFIGMFQGTIMSLSYTVIADVLGPEMLKHTYGLSVLFYSVGTLLAPSTAGLLKDEYGTYRYPFYFAGWWCFAGAGFFLLNTYLNRKTKAKREKETLRN